MVAVKISWLSIGNTFSFGGKPGEKGIDLNRTEFLWVSKLMKTYEISDPVPVGLFSTDAVVMQTHHCPELFFYTVVMIE